MTDFSALEASSPEDKNDAIPLPVDETAKRLVIGIVEEAICISSTTMNENEADIAETPEAELSSKNYAVTPENPDLQPEESSEEKETDTADLLGPKLSFNEKRETRPGENKKKADISNPECLLTKTDELLNESLDEAAFSKDLLSSTILNVKETEIADTNLTPEETVDKFEQSIVKAEKNEFLESGELADSTLEPGQLLDRTKPASKGSDLEDGEVSGEDDDVKSNPTDVFQADVPICRFYVRSACTWGRNCRFRHPEPSPKGKYQMFENKVLPVATAPPPPSEFLKKNVCIFGLVSMFYF